MLRVFPEPYFVDELAVLPEEGLWGFDLNAGDAAAESFFFALLQELWKNRLQNKRFQPYQRFPWGRRPRPAFNYIRVIEWGRRTPEEENLVHELERQFVDGLAGSSVRLTPDYLVGWVYRSSRGWWTGTPDYYYVMPLGQVTVEVSRPRPDWKPFLAGQLAKEALAEAFGSEAPAGGPYLEHRRYLLVRGRGVNGEPAEMAFEWYDTVDKEWEEAEFVVRFVQTARE